MTDPLLIDACLRGDVTSQRTLFQRHRGTLRGVFTRMGFDPAEVAELEQHVWLRLLGPRRALASFSGQGSFDGWLRRVALNEARSELRRRQRARPLEAIEPLVERIAGPRDPERDTIKDEKRSLMASALEDVLDALDPTERALLMAWAAGATTDALAREHQVHRSSMSRRLDKVRRRVGARVRAQLWESYGRGLVEVSVTALG